MLLHFPNKVKNLLWQARRNSMPTKANLVRRTAMDNPTYDRCNLAQEDQLALWSCSELDEVWSDSTLWGFRGVTQFGTFKELAIWIFWNQVN